MARALPAALRECDCKVADFDLLEYALYSMGGAYDRRLGWVSLPGVSALRGGDKTTVEDLVVKLTRK